MDDPESSARRGDMPYKMACIYLLLACISVTVSCASTRSSCVSRRRILFCDWSSSLPPFPLESDITTLVIGDRLELDELQVIKRGFDGRVIVKGNELCQSICDDRVMKTQWKHRCHCEVRDW